MNVFHKLARESLKKNRTRTLVTVIGVVLSAALITGVMSFGYSLLRTLADATAVRYGDWHLAVEQVDSTFLAVQQEADMVEQVIAFDELGSIVSEDGTPLRLVGFTDETFTGLPLTLISGRLPQNDRELVLQDSSGTLAPGDIVTTVSDRGESVQYTVAGVCAHPGFDREPSDTLFAITRLEQLSHSTEKTAFLKLYNPYAIRSYADDIAQSSYYNHKLLRFLGIWETGDDSIMVTLMLTVSIVVIGIIMTGSVFLIFNSFQISLNERTRQIGILASVGATPRQLRSSVLYEGLWVGALGIPTGVLTGLGAIRLVMAATADSFGDIFPLAVRLRLYWSAPLLLGAVLISYVTILISAYLPAKKAAELSVMDCIRQTGEIKVTPKAVKIAPLTQALLGLEGTLALKNFKRNNRQYRSVILSLVLSILLFVSTSSFTQSLSVIARNAQMVTDYDLGFGSKEVEDDALFTLFEKSAALHHVTGRSLQAVYEVPLEAEGSSYIAILQFLDNDSYAAFLSTCGLADMTGAYPTLAKGSAPDADSIQALPNLFQSDSLTATVNGQQLPLICVEAMTPDIPPFHGSATTLPYTLQIVLPWEMQQTLTADIAPWVKGLTLCSEDSAADRTQLQSMVEAVGISGSYLLLDCAELLDSNNSLVFVANLFSYTFIVMITLIAVANVFNTISTNLRLRRRELAMLRSVGMGDRAFYRMMRFECVFYGLYALLFGLPLSLLLSYGIQSVMTESGSIVFRFPWLPLGVSTIGVLLIILITMMYTVSRLNRENIIDALRDEMT